MLNIGLEEFKMNEPLIVTVGKGLTSALPTGMTSVLHGCDNTGAKFSVMTVHHGAVGRNEAALANLLVFPDGTYHLYRSHARDTLHYSNPGKFNGQGLTTVKTMSLKTFTAKVTKYFKSKGYRKATVAELQARGIR